MPGENDERDAEIWALAQAGESHSAIAERFGISRARVGQIVMARTPVEWGFSDQARAAVRYQESEVLKRMAKKVEAVISDPPLVHSAIGRTVEDPRKPGSYLINETVRVAAIRERRLISESYRRLTGTDLAHGDRTMSHDDANKAMMAAIADERAKRDKQLAELDRARAALPGAYIDAEVIRS